MKKCTFCFDYVCISYVESTYVNGVEDGVKFEFDCDDHWIRHIGYYKKGEPDGRWTWFNKDGSISSSSLYKDGKIIEEYAYDKSGKCIKKYICQNGVYVGFEESYYENGDLHYRIDKYEDCSTLANQGFAGSSRKSPYKKFVYHYEGNILMIYEDQDITKYYDSSGRVDREIYERDGKRYVRSYYLDGTSYEMSWDDYMDAMR
jgi:antitoxin component YwqK of YwqJK toxin-antitoxin module